MNHMTQLAKLVDKKGDYAFPIQTIPMKGVFQDYSKEGLISDIDCNDRVMIIRTDTNEYVPYNAMVVSNVPSMVLSI